MDREHNTRTQSTSYTKEVILMLFIVFVIYCMVLGGPSLGGDCHINSPHLSAYVHPHSNKGVKFADDVQQRRYSKRTGRVLGDTTIGINDHVVPTAV